MGQSAYVLAVVFVIWIALAAYLAWIAGLLRRTRREVSLLEDRLDGLRTSTDADHDDRRSASTSSP